METRRTHNTDKMVANGIRLLSYHTHKVCNPARASLITDRYTWEVGYYEMQGNHAVLLNNVYRCYWKPTRWLRNTCDWNVTSWCKYKKEYAPTFRGFDSLCRHCNTALADYWYHGGGVQGERNVVNATGLSNNTCYLDVNGVQHVNSSLNGTYDQDLFTNEAVRLIRSHVTLLPSRNTLVQQSTVTTMCRWMGRTSTLHKRHYHVECSETG